MDTADFKDGKQSLKFLVRDCSPVGGRLSPGFANEMEAVPGQAYTISFWIKNEGAEFVAKIGGVAPTTSEIKTIIQSKETINTWRKIEHTFTIPQKYSSMRFELNILQLGVFWVDDIKIEMS